MDVDEPFNVMTLQLQGLERIHTEVILLV